VPTIKINNYQNIMVLTLNKNTSKKEIQEIDDMLYKESTLKGFDAKKYNGKLKLKEDALIIQ
jgi:hypothetical protein